MSHNAHIPSSGSSGVDNTIQNLDQVGISDSSTNAADPPQNIFRRFFNWLGTWTFFDWWKLFLIVMIIAFIASALSAFGTQIQAFYINILNWINDHRIVGAIVFIAVYIAATVLFLPGLILTLGAGVVFSWPAIPIVAVGATIGACLAFLLGRYSLRKWVEKKLDSYPNFKAVDAAIAQKGWIIVLLLRLAPIMPFNILNYALALTKVSFPQYFFATAVGMLPGTAMYVYFGILAGGLSTIGSGQAGPSLTERIIIWVVSGVLIIVVVVIITIIAKRAIANAIVEAEKQKQDNAENGTIERVSVAEETTPLKYD